MFSRPCPSGRYGATEGLEDSDCSGVCEEGFFCEQGSISPFSVSCDEPSTHCPRGTSERRRTVEGEYLFCFVLLLSISLFFLFSSQATCQYQTEHPPFHSISSHQRNVCLLHSPSHPLLVDIRSGIRLPSPKQLSPVDISRPHQTTSDSPSVHPDTGAPLVSAIRVPMERTGTAK